MSAFSSWTRAAACLALAGAMLPFATLPASAENKTTPAFDAFVKAFADVKDYQLQIVTHETSDDGKSVQDRVYAYRWGRPSFARIEILEGPGKGGVASWSGGDKIHGHQGGILSMIHITSDINDARAVSLRGDNLEVTSFPWEIKHFETFPGTLSEADGPTIDGQATTAVTLTVADPKANKNVSRDVLYIGKERHLPLRREQYVGSQLVKTETYKAIKLNNGFAPGDFN